MRQRGASAYIKGNIPVIRGERGREPSVPLCEDRRTALLDVTHPNTFLSEGPNTPV